MKKKKLLCALVLAFMMVFAVPAMSPGLPAVSEVQAASGLTAPSLVSVRPYGKTKTVLRWKPVRGATGYRVYRRTNGGKWQAQKNISGYRNVSYSDTKVVSGNKYTYTVRAYRRSGGKVIWSSYQVRGVTTIAGLNYLKINVYRKNLYVGDYYDLKINGTKIRPTWKSSNSGIVWVYRNGRILAKRPGTATITASLGSKKFTCKVTVKNKSSASSKLARDYSTLKNYISRYGRTDGAGNKYLLSMYQGGDLKFIVRYFKKTDQINLRSVLAERSEGIQIVTDILVNAVKSKDATVKNIVTVQGLQVNSYTRLYVPNYREDDNLAFYMGGKTAPYEVSDLGGECLNLTLEGCHDLIRSRVGLSIGELGFTSF